MVHLSRIPVKANKPAATKDAEKKSLDRTKGQGHDHAQMHLTSYADEFSTSVYGSQYAMQELPRHEMPEGQMPKDVAYRMIKDELSLDNNPRLKYVSHI